MKASRIEAVEAYVMGKNVVSIKELCEHFNVSKSTIRRDIDEVLRRGTIKKVYGGVSASKKRSLISFTERHIVNPEGKNRIAQLASNQICNGDIVFIDSGTTTSRIVDYLTDRKNVTVITNNIDIAIHSIPNENINLIMLPGTLNRKTLSLVGSEAADILSTYNISKAFMATAGISVEAGVTNSSELECGIKKMAMQKSAARFLLIDDSKFDAVSLMTYAQVSEFTAIVTNKRPSEKFETLFQNLKVELICPD